MDDGHFESFQHRSLGEAHRGLFRSRLAIFTVDKEMVVALTSLSSLNLSASPGEQRDVLTEWLMQAPQLRRCLLIKNTWNQISSRRKAGNDIFHLCKHKCLTVRQNVASVNILVLHMYYWKDIFLQLPPGEESVYPDVGGDDDEQREEEDLAVVGRVVDVRPVVWAENLNCQFHWFDFIQSCSGINSPQMHSNMRSCSWRLFGRCPTNCPGCSLVQYF